MDLQGVKYAVADTVRLMNDRIDKQGYELPLIRSDVSQKHMYDMAEKIQFFTDIGKACRWLGYMQGVLVGFNIITLDEAKEINRKYSTGD